MVQFLYNVGLIFLVGYTIYAFGLFILNKVVPEKTENEKTGRKKTTNILVIGIVVVAGLVASSSIVQLAFANLDSVRAKIVRLGDTPYFNWMIEWADQKFLDIFMSGVTIAVMLFLVKFVIEATPDKPTKWSAGIASAVIVFLALTASSSLFTIFIDRVTIPLFRAYEQGIWTSDTFRPFVDLFPELTRLGN